jgi:hypothetical protein
MDIAERFFKNTNITGKTISLFDDTVVARAWLLQNHSCFDESGAVRLAVNSNKCRWHGRSPNIKLRSFLIMCW